MESGDDVGANLAAADDWLREAADGGASLAVLPENFAGMAAAETWRRGIAEPDGNGPIQDTLADMARRHGLWLVGGTVPIADAGESLPAAACLVYDDHGARRGRYDKMHLFDVQIPDADEAYRESANTAPGRRTLTVDLPWGRLGVAVCYDLRFPELFSRLAHEGAEIVAVPAAFTRPTGSAHWEVLIRARAIDMLGYVAAAAQTGAHPGGRQTWGHSMLAGPWGEVLLDAGERPGVHLVGVDLARPAHLRDSFPVLEHRRARIDMPTDSGDEDR
ncbi:MAG: carbon-nitrogen hydrolase family protein [Chromatiales bacterium]|nr:MAG: carbon-nitrogen hydrolase family protein [Chromatiales bacterium]